VKIYFFEILKELTISLDKLENDALFQKTHPEQSGVFFYVIYRKF